MRFQSKGFTWKCFSEKISFSVWWRFRSIGSMPILLSLNDLLRMNRSLKPLYVSLPFYLQFTSYTTFFNLSYLISHAWGGGNSSPAGKLGSPWRDQANPKSNMKAFRILTRSIRLWNSAASQSMDAINNKSISIYINVFDDTRERDKNYQTIS